MKWVITLLLRGYYFSSNCIVPNVLRCNLLKLEKEIRSESLDTSFVEKKYYKYFKLNEILKENFLGIDSTSTVENRIEIKNKKNKPNLIWIKYKLIPQMDFFLKIYDSKNALGVVNLYNQNIVRKVLGIILVRKDRIFFIRQNPDFTRNVFLLNEFQYFFPVCMFSLSKDNKLVYRVDYLLESEINELGHRKWKEHYIVPQKRYRINNMDYCSELVGIEFQGYHFQSKIFENISGFMPWQSEEFLHRQ